MADVPSGSATVGSESQQTVGSESQQTRDGLLDSSVDESVPSGSTTAGIESQLDGSGSTTAPTADLAVAVFVAPVVSLRIGPEKYRYDYTIVDGIQAGERPVYRCRRGRDDEDGLLYLYWRDDCWHAESFVGAVTVGMNGGRPAFRALVGENVLEEGMHQWQCYNGSNGTWLAPSSFQTEHL